MASPARAAIALTMLLLSVGAAPAASAPQPATTVPFVTLAAGRRSAITSPTQVVIRDTAAWTALWRRHLSDAAASPPAVNFRTATVIALFAGRSPASTTVAIARIVFAPGGLVVYYTQGERRPLPLAEDAPEATPFHIVRVPRSTGAVRFVLLKVPPVLRPGPGS